MSTEQPERPERPDPPYDRELMAAVSDLGAALRELLDASVHTDVGAAQLHAAARDARLVTARLSAVRRPEHQLPSLDDPVAFRRVYSPVTGVGSAVAPPLVLRAADPRDPAAGVVCQAALGLVYEGPPGYLHGGMSSLLMDQVLGAAAISAGRWGMTARLELDYRGPVPLGAPVVLRGWVEQRDGRRTTVAGTIALVDDPERVLVRATGLFVTPRPETMTDYFASVTDASGAHAPPGRATDATALEA